MRDRVWSTRLIGALVGLGLGLATSSLSAQASSSSVKDRRGDVKICGKKFRYSELDIVKATARVTKDGKIVHVIRVAKRGGYGDGDLEIKLSGDKKPRYRFTGFLSSGYALLTDSHHPNADSVRVYGYSKQGNRFRYRFDPSMIGNPKKYRWKASTYPPGTGDCYGKLGDDAPNQGKPFRLQKLRTPKPSLIRITSGPRGKTSERSPSFSFVSPEVDTSFQCKLDKKKWTGCASPKRYSKLRPDKHVYWVRGSSPGGNLGGPASRRFVVEGSNLTLKTLEVSGKYAPLTLECPKAKPCSGKIEISGKVKKKILGSKGEGSQQIRMVKTTRYLIPANGSKRVRLRLTNLARKALKKTWTLVGTGTLIAGNGKKAKFKAVIKR